MELAEVLHALSWLGSLFALLKSRVRRASSREPQLCPRMNSVQPPELASNPGYLQPRAGSSSHTYPGSAKLQSSETCEYESN